ncbi:MAG: DNA-directed RNA polymerase subunit beta' [Lentisphaerae bacterium]|nr:DNA-directed RNA polymerase subunit beta' [Lentisphaerota bacterium]
MSDKNFANRDVAGKSSTNAFNAVSINVASPDVIRSWSFGEVKNPETINYRTLKPERGGLFCERIFGPTRDWECSCGLHKRVKVKGVVCDHCGVEVTQSSVRRERMGHIELAVPVSHIWFFKCMPSRIGLALDMTAKHLEKVIYYESWVVTDPGDTPFKLGQVLDELQYREAREDYNDAFMADMGAPAIKTLLEKLDMPAKLAELEVELQGTKNKAIRKKLSKRLRLMEGFINSNSRPEWMIMTVLPVIPPDLRPLVPLEGGRFATSDLNDLYRRVINRNNRLKNLLSQRTPEVIIRNEKRMLQEAVDALLDNGRHGRAVTGAGNRALKSLSDMLKGKQGRFRQNLLGKRVDYSGRSVIVVGPELKINQCGLPKKMAMILFEPFIIRHLKNRGYAHTVRGAKKMIERGEPVVWDILEEVTKGHPVMLNRAPTLHRLSIQAFDPVLIEGSALRIHPLVCTAYNADFDGDQMAVHVPLSNEAQMETKLLMLAPNNIFSPANGKPITTPTQDITLGSYYLTCEPRNPDRAKLYKDYFEVLYAMDAGFLSIHDAVRIPNPDFGKDTVYGDKDSKYILTTPGRCIFNEIWDKRLGFYNQLAKKKDLGKLISVSYKICGHDATIKLLDDLKALGYRHATRAGLSISITDLHVPDKKESLIADAREQIAKVVEQYNSGVLTDGERHNKVIDIWTQTSNSVASALFARLEDESRRGDINPVYAMLDSGARGSKDQIRQLAGMRGLMAKPSGDIIERPIISNFREGLSVLEYFISTHGARKGLADTALKTADSGYMTRKLVDVAQDVICREEDCGTVKGIWMSAIVEGDEVILPLRDRIVGRFAAMDLKDPAYSDGRVIVKAGEEITSAIMDMIEKRGIQRVLIRSNLTCETPHGVCVKCYGRNLASDRVAKVGDALGIIAAQSIGEPGTQLTMRTFHIGGTASSAYKEPVIKARNAGTLHLVNVRTVKNQSGETVVVSKNGYVIVYDAEVAKKAEEEARSRAKAEAEAIGSYYNKDYDYRSDALREAELDRYDIEAGAVMSKGEGQTVKAEEQFVHWDPYHVPIIIEEAGRVSLIHLIEGMTLSRQRRGGTEEFTVMEHRDDLSPQIVVKDDNDEVLASYPLPAGAFVMAREGEHVEPGVTVARVPRQSAKNKDITGGLPRIAELFEARQPREIAEIARIDGFVQINAKNSKGRRQILIENREAKTIEEHGNIPANKHLLVSNGDYVHKGDKLTEGSIVPHALLEICGPHELQRFLVNEIQLVYRAQGVEINDKHIEIIIRQMMQKVRITEPGDTEYLVGEAIDRVSFDAENRKVAERGGRPAEGEPILLGITKASLETDSFISAASFQDTTRILTEAATLGKSDELKGFKENVITGHLIPAGTGTEQLQYLKLKYYGEEIPREQPELTEEEEENKVLEEQIFEDDDDMFGDDAPLFGEGSILDDEADLDDMFADDQDFDNMELEDVIEDDFSDDDDE